MYKRQDLGNVAFSGDYSFKHVLSLLKINIKGEGDMAQAVIDKIRLEGYGLTTQGYYSFETNRFIRLLAVTGYMTALWASG